MSQTTLYQYIDHNNNDVRFVRSSYTIGLSIICTVKNHPTKKCYILICNQKIWVKSYNVYYKKGLMKTIKSPQDLNITDVNKKTINRRVLR